jgi:hypothetical protein
MIFYILIGVILCIILFFVYIRIRYKFWSLQPVFHFYDIYYWFVNVGIIRTQLPEKNRYTNTQCIVTQPFELINNITKRDFHLLIQSHYFVKNENKYNPMLENILPYFNGHNAPAYWSYYFVPELYQDTKTGNTIENRQLVGVITSRPLHVNLQNNKFDVYYVDYLCVHKRWRNKNIAPQLIQTHEYNQSYQNRAISVSLFKREEELTGIIPLTVYKTYCYLAQKYVRLTEITPGYILLAGDKQNMYYFYNFINDVNSRWNIIIYPEITNLLELVKTNNLFIQMLMKDGVVSAIYVFRKTCTFIDKNKEILSCIASICGNDTTDVDFISGFQYAICSIVRQWTTFKYLTIENISDNNKFISHTVSPVAVSPTAYFFYNFAYNPFDSNTTFIIN